MENGDYSMIYTGNYDNCKGSNTISISGDKGKSTNYQGNSFPQLAPKLSFWKEWHNNIGILTETENNDFYISQYYKLVLSILNPEEVYKALKDKILLCYEEPLNFCHRHIVAAWLETELGILVPEVASINNKIELIEQNTQVREDYKRLILSKK